MRRRTEIDLKDKDVTVVGLARSGVGSANLLAELGANVTITDIKAESELKDSIPRLSPSVKLVLGSHPEDIFLSSDILIVSPGVPLSIPPISKAREKGIPVVGELELAYQIIKSIVNSQQSSKQSSVNSHLSLVKPDDQSTNSSPQFLAVTGTNGKSTTTALLDFMMKKGGFRTILGGNVGNALTEEILKAYPPIPPLLRGGEGGVVDYIVAEVSSFQLESIKDFRPKVAVIVNITPDHLDRYHSFKEYADAKARIFENQREGDFLVLNKDDPELMKIVTENLEGRSKKPAIFYFSRKKDVIGVYFRKGVIYCNLPHPSLPTSHFPLVTSNEIRIKGVHNLENAMAASAMALLAKCPIEAVTDSLREFPGLEHRLEFVREIDGVKYFNDSKGTNVGAVIKSLESFLNPIILIAGGRDKAGDFSLLRQLVRERVKAIVLIGEASEKIKRTLGNLTETVRAKDLREAVNISRSMAVEGDIVLLSPACASFDMFIDFEDRGRKFKDIVMEMS